MHVGQIQQIVQPFERLQRNPADVGQIRRHRHQALARAARAADHEHDRGIVAQPPGRFDQQLQPLLFAQIARIERHHGVLCDAEFRPQRARPGQRPHRVHVRPVGQQRRALGCDALGDHALAHGLGNGRHAVEAAQQRGLAAQREAPQRPAGQQPQIEGRVHFQILNVQPGPRAGQARREQGRRRREQRRLHAQHQIRPPARLGQHHRRAARRKARQMREALGAARLMRHPQGAAPDLGRRAVRPAPGLAPVAIRPVACAHCPVGVVGRGGDDAHRMAARRQPAGHLAGVLADPDQFGREIDAVDEDFQFKPSRKVVEEARCFAGAKQMPDRAGIHGACPSSSIRR